MLLLLQWLHGVTICCNLLQDDVSDRNRYEFQQMPSPTNMPNAPLMRSVSMAMNAPYLTDMLLESTGIMSVVPSKVTSRDGVSTELIGLQALAGGARMLRNAHCFVGDLNKIFRSTGTLFIADSVVYLACMIGIG